jgi:hypothetical protein
MTVPALWHTEHFLTPATRRHHGEMDGGLTRFVAAVLPKLQTSNNPLPAVEARGAADSPQTNI